MQALQVRYTFFIHLGVTALLQHFAHLRVSQTGMRVNHCLVKTVAREPALARKLHLTHHRQAIHLRLERAQPVGQGLGQHRHHTLGKVHRIAALDSLFIQGHTGANVMRHIGNGDKQTPAPQPFFTIHSVIKVAGIFAVYGDKWPVA